MQLAHGVLSDYLSEELSVSLHKNLSLPDPATPRSKQRATSNPEGQNEPKKAKMEGPAEDYTASAVPIKKVRALLWIQSKIIQTFLASNLYWGYAGSECQTHLPFRRKFGGTTMVFITVR